MRILKIAFVVLLTLSVTLTAFAGGGWTQPKKSGYFKLGQSFLIANHYYQPNGDIVDITTISLYATSLYGEYGITDRITGMVYFPFFVRSTLNQIEFTSGREPVPGDAVNSLGDADVSFKYGLITEGPVVLSASLTLGIPLGKTAGGDTRILQTGDGEFNQMITLEASHSFHPLPMYTTALIGLNNRTKNFSEEFRYGLEVGYTFAEKLITQIRIYGVSSFKNGDAAGGGGNSIFANDTEYLAITPEIAYQIQSNFGITASAGFAAYGKKILANPNFMVGAYFTF